MRLLLVLFLASLSSISFATDFVCSANVMEKDQKVSGVDIDSYWRSSTFYENISLSVPKRAEPVYFNLDIDSRNPDAPSIAIKVKDKSGRKIIKRIQFKKLGDSKEYKLDKKFSIRFSCS